MQDSEGVSNSRGHVHTFKILYKGLVQSTCFPLTISTPCACKLMQTDGVRVKLDFCKKLKTETQKGIKGYS